MCIAGYITFRLHYENLPCIFVFYVFCCSVVSAGQRTQLGTGALKTVLLKLNALTLIFYCVNLKQLENSPTFCISDSQRSGT